MQNHVANFRSVQFMSQHDATRDMDQGIEVYIDLPQYPFQNKLPISTFGRGFWCNRYSMNNFEISQTAAKHKTHKTRHGRDSSGT